MSPAHAAFAIPGLDFYALDWYDTWTPPLFQALNQWRRNVGAIQRSLVLAIAETNSRIPARRPYWFSAVFGWLRGYQLENGGRAWATGATCTRSARCPGPGCRTTPRPSRR